LAALFCNLIKIQTYNLAKILEYLFLLEYLKSFTNYLYFLNFKNFMISIIFINLMIINLNQVQKVYLQVLFIFNQIIVFIWKFYYLNKYILYLIFVIRIYVMMLMTFMNFLINFYWLIIIFMKFIKEILVIIYWYMVKIYNVIYDHLKLY